MSYHFKYCIIVFLTAILMVSCNEEEFADWEIMNEAWFENYVEQHKNDSNFFQTKSGLCYRIIHQSSYTQPHLNSIIYVDYHGKLIDGTIFDEGENVGMYLSETIRGWQEGVRKMRNGAHFIFYVPSKLAYGEKGSGKVPPNSTLIFDIKLVRTIN
jgi:FKBP-type peptidyl-prolyl cis-trans isomerase